MTSLLLHAAHTLSGAVFSSLGESEIVAHYGNPTAEYETLRHRAGVLDLSFRGRICLTGADRVRLLHGQVTNDVQRLKPGEGCYAALVTAKGKIQSDLSICALADELLLDFEPGLTQTLTQRFEHYIIAEDVQVVDVSPFFGLLSVQGPAATEALLAAGFKGPFPKPHLGSIQLKDPALGEVYIVQHSRIGVVPPLGSVAVQSGGFDLFVPVESLAVAFERLLDAVRRLGGGPVGWQALEWVRIEAGIPRFGTDLDESNLAPEGGDDFIKRAISYSKGCYIGQEVIARIRTYGKVAKSLRGLRAVAEDAPVAQRGDKLLREGREVGYVTSALRSPAMGATIALGHVRREFNTTGTELVLLTSGRSVPMKIVPLPFEAAP